MYTIEDLKNGKVAVINDGTLEELRRVLKEAFPNDGSLPNGALPLYRGGNYSNDFWVGSSYSKNLPKQSVKEFIKQLDMEEFKYGEKVEVFDTNYKEWIIRTFIGINPINKAYITINKHGIVSNWDTCRKIQETKELTLKEIADKFGYDVNKIRIKE